MMGRIASLTVLTAVLFGMGGLPLRAQSANVEATKGMQEWGVWGGEGLVATTAFGGLTRPEAAGRMSAVLGLRYGRVLLVRDSLTLSYIGDLVPIEIQRGNVTRESDPLSPTARATVFGTGLAPLGLKASFGRARVKPLGVIMTWPPPARELAPPLDPPPRRPPRRAIARPACKSTARQTA